MSNTSLNGELEEEVCMYQPLSFVDLERLQYVCKFKKAFYRYKQAPRAWFKKVSTCLHLWGFETYNVDIYDGFKLGGDMVIFLFYIDGIVVIGGNYILIQKMIPNLYRLLAPKDLRTLSFFCSIEVTRNADGFHLR